MMHSVQFRISMQMVITAKRYLIHYGMGEETLKLLEGKLM